MDPSRLKSLVMKDNVRTIMVRCPNWIGDAVMATPVFRDIKAIFPYAKVTALAHEPIAELLVGLDGVDDLLIFSREATKRHSENKRILAHLRTITPDVGILLTRSFSSSWMFWRASIPIRIGFSDHFRRLLLTHPIPLPQEEQHDVLSYQMLLKPFGSVCASPQLQLYVSQPEIHVMRMRLEKAGVSASARLLVVNPGAAYGSAKCWPKEYFRAVIKELSAHPNTAVVGIGNAAFRESINEILQALPNTYNFAGETTVRELMALLSISHAVLTNDSGPMHIAAAFKKPLVALFGSTNPRRTGPWNCGTVIYKHVPCSPCYRRTCPGDFRCMTSITPEEVLDVLHPMLTS